MNDIARVLETARRRLRTSALLHELHTQLLTLALLALVVAVVGKTWPALGDSAWYGLWTLAAVAAVAVAIAVVRWSLDRRWSREAVATEVDQRLNLRERLSTALRLSAADDPFARAAVTDAVEVARSSPVQHGVRREFRVTGPAHWWVSPAVLGVVVLVGAFVPQGDLFARGGDEEGQPTPEELAEVERIREELEKSIQELAKNENLDLNEAEIRKFVEGEMPDHQKPEAKPNNPEEARREAFRKYNSMMDLVRQRTQEANAQKMEALNQKLARLATDPELQDSDLAQALARGDFAAAQAELENLKQAITKGELTPEQQQQVAAMMNQLAQNMTQLANANQAMADALRQAGLNPGLAANPQALQQALQNAANLTEQERQQLQQMAQAMAAANQQLAQMAAACSQCAGGMQGGGQNPGGTQPGGTQPGGTQPGGQNPGGMNGQLAQGMSQLGDMLSQAEGLQQELMAASAQLAQLQQQAQQLGQGQCQGQGMGQGLQQMLGQSGQNGMQWTQGGAMGQRGVGAGGRASRVPTQGNLTPDRPPTMGDANAPIIWQRFFDDPNLVRGDSRREIGEAIAAGKLRADEELNQNRIPKKFEPAVKTYFGDLDARARIVDLPGNESGENGGEGDAASTPSAAENASEGKSSGG